jgi:hypothetical protein
MTAHLPANVKCSTCNSDSATLPTQTRTRVNISVGTPHKMTCPRHLPLGAIITLTTIFRDMAAIVLD